MIGTSDQSCWLAEACEILLLLLLCMTQSVETFHSRLTDTGKEGLCRDPTVSSTKFPFDLTQLEGMEGGGG